MPTAKEIVPTGREIVMRDLESLLHTVPESDADGSGIVIPLINATADELIELTKRMEDGASLPDIEQWFDQEIIVTRVTKLVSTYTSDENYSPYYLAVEFNDGEETVTATTSALQAMVVFSVLHKDHALPARVKLTPGNMTRQGRIPLNVIVYETRVGIA